MNENLAAEKMTAIAAKGATANRLAFADWMLTCVPGAEKMTAKERAAFIAGATIAEAGYKLYQSSKTTSTRYVAPEPVAAEPVKPVRKPRTRKAAPAAAAAEKAAK